MEAGIRTWLVVVCAVLTVKQASCSLSDEYFKLTAKDIDGKPVDFAQFKGMATLVVNTASMCGFSDTHLRDMTRIHQILAHGGHFQLLAFPCNQFGEQEPGDPGQVKQYVLVNFESEFLLMEKVEVIGEDAHPVFKNIVGQSSTPPDWNFYKYLVDHTGRVTQAWGPRVAMGDIFSQVQAAVKAAEAAAAGEGETEATPAEPVGPAVKEEL